VDRSSRYLMIARSIGIATTLYLFLVTGLAKRILALPTPTTPSPLIPSRIIANPGFEQPVVSGIGVAIPEGYGTTPPTVWQTTEDTSPYVNSLEYWNGTGNGQSPSNHSGQHVELNAASNSAIYQDICVLQNETVDWSLLHAVRKATVANDTNIMRVTVSNPTLWIGKTPPSTLLYSSPDLATSFNDGWQQKTGSYTYTGTSARLRFAFNAIQGSVVGTTRNISYGNFLDDVALSLPPVIDFLPTNVTNKVNLSTTAEGDGGSPYYLSLRLNGRLKSAATVTITLTGLTAPRNFTVGTPLQGTATVTGLSASKSGSSITLTLPAGDYDPNNITKYVHIPIDFGDLVYQPNDNVGFSLTSATGGGSGTIAVGSSACETARTSVPIAVQEDDIRQIKGRVFEDINYGGGAGRSLAVGGTPVFNARVELYNTGGNFVATTNTDNTGAYQFSNLPTSITYYVRVVNSTITSNRLLNTPTTGLLPVQTFRSDATTGTAMSDANRVGGEKPSVADALSGSIGTVMSSAGLLSGNLTGQAQSIATITAGTANISNLDFGYNFDTIVNTNDAGQGSLRQFIANSNALNNNNLAQVGQLSGKEVSIFMIPLPSGSPPGGLKSGLVSQLTAGRALISLASPLTISDTDTSIDGRTQTTNVGNSNSLTLGSGGLVGVDNLSLAQLNAPEVELINSGSVIHGIIVDGANATIQGIAIHGFGTVGNNQGDILLQATNPLVTQNAIGFTATSFTAPTANQSQSGIVVNGSTNATIANNIIGFTNERGILGGRTSMNLSGLVIRENEIKQPGNISGTVGQHSAIELFPSTTGNISITRNLLTDSQADSGIAIRPAVIGTSSSFLVQNNSILRNGAGNASGFGILLQASTANSDLQGIKIDKNILNQNRRGIDSQQTAVTISGNVVSNSLGGYGVAIEAGKQKNKITQNSIFGNVGIGIDLGNTANGITPNNGTLSTTISNQDLDYPLITSAMLSSGTLTTKGYVGNNPDGNTTFGNLILEFFIADNTPADQNGEVVVGDTRSKPHGEGKTYIGSCTTDANGIFGNSTNPCVFSNAGTLGLTAATNITATATDSNGNTSEFSASPSSRANLVLVKRITAITSAATGLTTSYNSYIHESGSTKDNDLGWPTNYLSGEINPGQVRPGDEIEYTIYYLNNGENRIGQAKVCDALNKNLDFVLNFNSSNVGKGILLSPSSSTSIYLTNTSGDDRGEYSTTSPTDCNLVGNVTADQSTNTVVVNAASSSNPILGGAYGFIKFKVKVKS
jgi:uncharacterized repeat protein (TIGR01451 family)